MSNPSGNMPMTAESMPTQPGATPPLAVDNVIENPMNPVQAEVEGAVSSVDSSPSWWTRTKEKVSDYKKGVIVGAVGVVALVGGSVLLNACTDDDNGNERDPVEEEVNLDDFEACPDGIFENGYYAATEPALPQELHVRPGAALDSVESTVEYYYGENGVACEAAPTSAAITAISADLLGGGGPGNVFGNTDMNSLMRELIDNPEKAQNSVDATLDVLARGQVNEEAIEETTFRVIVEPTDDPENPYTIMYQEEVLQLDANSALVLDWRMVAGDDPEGANRDQKVYIDFATGQIHVIKAVGAPIQEQTEAEQGGGQDQEGDQQADQEQDQQGGGGSGTGTGTGGGGEGGEGGGCGATCGHGGGGEGDVCDTCGAGGGQQPTGPGGPGGPTPTQPPATNPPTTRPPVTTSPTSPTTSPHPTHPPATGSPPGVNQ